MTIQLSRRQTLLTGLAVSLPLPAAAKGFAEIGWEDLIPEGVPYSLLAVLPGVALQELWAIVGIAETALIAVSAMVVLTALIGMTGMIFSSLNERRREMAIWRAMGARPATILGLLVTEAVLIAAIGALLGFALVYAALAVGRPLIDAAFGLWLPIGAPTLRDAAVLGTVIGAAALASLLPALRAYKLSLADGMMVRI